jgi:hypothetical protein
MSYGPRRIDLDLPAVLRQKTTAGKTLDFFSIIYDLFGPQSIIINSTVTLVMWPDLSHVQSGASNAASGTLAGTRLLKA